MLAVRQRESMLRVFLLLGAFASAVALAGEPDTLSGKPPGVEPTVITRVGASAPTDFADAHPFPVSCTVRVAQQADGLPSFIDVEDCPLRFHELAKQGFRQWRWAASEDGVEKGHVYTATFSVPGVPFQATWTGSADPASMARVEGGEAWVVPVVDFVYRLGGSKSMHHTEVKTKRRESPVYPQAAKDLKLGDVNCKVRVFIDEEGAPYDLKFLECPEVFHESARDALLQWRWYPVWDGGQKTPANFYLFVRYRHTP